MSGLSELNSIDLQSHHTTAFPIGIPLQEIKKEENDLSFLSDGDPVAAFPLDENEERAGSFGDPSV